MPITQHNVTDDPLRNFRFHVNISHTPPGGNNQGNLLGMGFMTVSGLQIETTVITYREGGLNTTTRKLPGQTEFQPIRFDRGLYVGPAHVWEWFLEIFSVIQGSGTGATGNNFRGDLEIDVMDHPVTKGTGAAGTTSAQAPGNVKAKFKVYNAWPMMLNYSDLDASANGIFVESLTLAHEGWEVVTLP